MSEHLVGRIGRRIEPIGPEIIRMPKQIGLTDQLPIFRQCERRGRLVEDPDESRRRDHESAHTMPESRFDRRPGRFVLSAGTER